MSQTEFTAESEALYNAADLRDVQVMHFHEHLRQAGLNPAERIATFDSLKELADVAAEHDSPVRAMQVFAKGFYDLWDGIVSKMVARELLKQALSASESPL